MRRGAPSARGLLLAAVTFTVAVGALAAPAGAAPTQRQFIGLTSDETFEQLGALAPSNADDFKRLGAGTVRQTFDWQFLLHGMAPGQLNLLFTDRYMLGMAQRRVRVLPVLFNPPDGLTRKPQFGAKRGKYRPLQYAYLGQYGQAIARRYGRNGSFWKENPGIPYVPITHYQVWNEPNLPVYWQPKPNAKQYVNLLRSTRRLIRVVDPKAKIVTAGLPQSKIKGSISQTKFIAQMYKAGGRKTFDVLAVNPYAGTPKGVRGRIRLVRKMMNKRKDAKKELWATEIGWADKGPRRKGKRVGFDVGPTKQARFVSQVIPMLWRDRKYLKLRGFVYYALRDQQVYQGGKDFWGLHTGLRRLDGRPKKAWRSFERAARKLKAKDKPTRPAPPKRKPAPR